MPPSNALQTGPSTAFDVELRTPAEARQDAVAVSVVAPVFDEVDSLPALHAEIVATMERLGGSWEVIYVDDGSRDGSIHVLEGLQAGDPHVRVVQFRRNYGQTAALAAGFAYAAGDVVVTLDADLQNDPADIPRLLEKVHQGYDVVCGWRRRRRDPWLSRRLPSWAANRLINKLIEGTEVQLHDFGCTLKAYRAGVVKRLTLYGEMHRFIPAFAAWLGVRVAEVEVNHRPRRQGRSKYGIGRVLRVLPDLVTVRFFSDYFTKPAHFFGKIAAAVLGGGVALTALLTLLAATVDLPVDLNTGLMILVLTGLVAVQFVCLGLLGEIIIRGYQEQSGRVPYVVRRVLQARQGKPHVRHRGHRR